MEEKDWALLISYATNNRLVPVLGSEMTQINTGAQTEPLYRHLAKMLWADVNPAKPYTGQSLQEICMNEPDRSLARSNIYRKYNNIQARDFDYRLVRAIMNITGFNLFISASIDPGFEKQLAEVRGNATNKVSTYYSDLTTDDFMNLKIEREEDINLAYIFEAIRKSTSGNSIGEPSEFATDDEERMEYLYKLAKSISKDVYNNLLNYVRGKSLLILGCAFPDWYMRFMIRILTDKRFKGRETTVYVVSNDNVVNQLNEQYFYDNFKIKIIQPPLLVSEFVDEFSQRWNTNKANFNDNFPGAKVFISYYRKDSQGSHDIFTNLRQTGVDAWFDTEDLKAGEFEPNILKQVKDCSIFVPVLSDNILTNPACFSREKEWDWIFNLNNLKLKVPLIIPVILDNISKTDERIPELFKANSIFNWQDEKQPFLNKLTDALRNKS